MVKIGMSEESALNQTTRERIAQLAHDIRDDIFVVEMGLEALKGVQNNPERLAALIEEIRRDGVRPLQECLTVLLDLIRDQK